MSGDDSARVLVVDDDLDSREMLCSALEDAGFRPMRAYNGKEALLILHSRRPRFVILDLTMPDVSGWEVLRQLKADPALASIPVVVATGRPFEASGLKRSDIAAYLKKPFDLDKLLRVLDYFSAHAPEPASAH